MKEARREEPDQARLAEELVDDALERVDSGLRNFFDEAGEIAGGNVSQRKRVGADVGSCGFAGPVTSQSVGGTQPGCVVTEILEGEVVDGAIAEADCVQTTTIPAIVMRDGTVVKQACDRVGAPDDLPLGISDCSLEENGQSGGPRRSQQAFDVAERLMDDAMDQVLAEEGPQETVMVTQAEVEDGNDACGATIIEVDMETTEYHNDVVAHEVSQKQIDSHGNVVIDNDLAMPLSGHVRASSLDGRVSEDEDGEEVRIAAQGEQSDAREVVDERALPLTASDPGSSSTTLVGGNLSAAFLASKGYLCSDNDESDSESEDSDDDDDGMDETTAICDSGEGDEMKRKRRATCGDEGQQSHDSGDWRPPFTKNENDGLPPVPEVTAVLGPHHKLMFIGRISSVLDLQIIVATSGGGERVFDEGSVLWLTESRTALGIVDEIFGPVKDPFYVVRFNNVSDIPGDAIPGASVSYVDEFTKIILKGKPSLFQRAVDASGLDDEEIPSDEDLEFSDDEKEAAARLTEKNKGRSDGRQARPSQGCNSSEGPRTERQRTGVGRGHCRRGGRGASQSNGRDFGDDAGTDLRGSQRLAGSAWQQRNGRNRNHEKWNSSRRVEDRDMQHRRGGTGPANNFDVNPRPQYFHQNTHGSPYTIQANSQTSLPGQRAFQAPAVQSFPSNPGPAHLSHDLPHFGMPAQYASPRGPQPYQIPRVFNPCPQFNPFSAIPGGLMMPGPGFSTNVHQPQMSFGLPMLAPVGGMQAEGLAPIYALTTPSQFGSGITGPNFRAQPPLQNGHGQDPPAAGRHTYNGLGGEQPRQHQQQYQQNDGSQF